MEDLSLNLFDEVIEDLRKFYRMHALIDIYRVRPSLDRLRNIAHEDEANRAHYLARFQEAVDTIRDGKIRGDISMSIHVLDYCMLHLRWPEIGLTLKNEYARIEDLDSKIQVEAMIKRIYDPSWDGGEFESIPMDEDRWD